MEAIEIANRDDRAFKPGGRRGGIHGENEIFGGRRIGQWNQTNLKRQATRPGMRYFSDPTRSESGGPFAPPPRRAANLTRALSPVKLSRPSFCLPDKLGDGSRGRDAGRFDELTQRGGVEARAGAALI